MWIANSAPDQPDLSRYIAKRMVDKFDLREDHPHQRLCRLANGKYPVLHGNLSKRTHVRSIFEDDRGLVTS
jgi:hypothetical protein